MTQLVIYTSKAGRFDDDSVVKESFTTAICDNLSVIPTGSHRASARTTAQFAFHKTQIHEKAILTAL